MSTGNPTPTPTPAPKTPRRWLRWALVVSVALNLAVAGVVAGGMIRANRIDAQAGGPDTMRLLWRSLPDEVRSDLRDRRMDRAPRDARAERRERDEALHSRMLMLLRDDPFDSSAFIALLNEDGQRRAMRLEQAHTALARRLARLDADTRADIAERLERRRHFRGDD